MKKRVVSFCFLTSLFLPLVLVAQTPPDEFLGHRVGADRKREKRSKASGKKAVQKEEKRIIKLVRRAENGDGEALCEIRKIVDVEPADWAEWATSPIRLNKLWLRWQQQRT